jgi:hypothetical protein
MTNTSIDTNDANTKGGPRPSRTKNTIAKPDIVAPSKTDQVLKKLRTAKGVTVPQIAEATGWQVHSVRGFLSGTVKKKLGLNLVSEVAKDGTRRYRVAVATAEGEAA